MAFDDDHWAEFEARRRIRMGLPPPTRFCVLGLPTIAQMAPTRAPTVAPSINEASASSFMVAIMQNEFFALTTAQLAMRLRTTSGAIYQRRLREGGSFFGVTPRKLPNGRLLWSLEDVAAVFGGSRVDLRSEPKAVQLLVAAGKRHGVPVCAGLVEVANQLFGHGVAHELEIESLTGPILVAMLNRMRADIERLPADFCAYDMSRVGQVVDLVVEAAEAIRETWAAKLATAKAKAAEQ